MSYIGSLSTPLVSVVIPTYNRAHTIKRCLQTVLSQSFKDFEVIIVNDGDRDGTKELISSLQDSRVQYLEHANNKGQSAARNTGIRASKGKYIAFQDSDDEWLPDKLEKQVRSMLTAPAGTGIVYTEKYNDLNGVRNFTPTRGRNKSPQIIRRELLKGSMITSQVALVLGECFSRVGLYDEELRHLEDWELWIRISKYYDIVNIGEPLAVIHTDTRGISNNLQALTTSLQSILFKHFDEFYAEGNSVLALQYYYLSRLMRLNSQKAEARSYLVRALKTDKLNVKYWLRYFESILDKQD